MDKEVKEFIAKNNLFDEVGDRFDTYQTSHPSLGLFGKPNSTANVRKVKSSNALMYAGEEVYSAKYTLDTNGLRNTPQKSDYSSDVAIVFGDNMAFGTGVNDNQTFPFYLYKLNFKYKAYNYGFLGHGPNHMLTTIQSDSFKKKFKNQKGKVFFLLRDDAIKIACCKIPWAYNYPKYEIENNKLIYKGSFSSSDFNIDPMYLPSEYTEEDINLTVEILKKSQRELHKISLDLELITIILPITFSSQQIETRLVENNFRVFNFHFADMEYHTTGYSRFVDGNHTAKSHNALAFWLSRLLFFKLKRELTYLLNKVNNQKLFEIYSFMMPSVHDFPIDDAGVIVSMYGGDLQSCEKFWRKKLALIKKLEKDKHIPAKHLRDYLLQHHILHGHENIKVTFSKKDLLEYEPFFEGRSELLDIFYYEYFDTLKR